MKVAEFEFLSVVFDSERDTNSIATANHDASPTVLFFSPVGTRASICSSERRSCYDWGVKTDLRYT
jgi:hypothetical protein